MAPTSVLLEALTSSVDEPQKETDKEVLIGFIPAINKSVLRIRKGWSDVPTEQFRMKPAQHSPPPLQNSHINRSHGNYVVCTISLSESLWFMNNNKSKLWVLQILS